MKKLGTYIVVAILLVAALVSVYILTQQYKTPTPYVPTTSPTETQTTTTPSIVTPQPNIAKIVVDMINEYRKNENIPPVELISLEAPQYRATYMYQFDYLSHYSREGIHPVYYYTVMDGGIYAIEENAGMSYCTICDPQKAVAQVVYNMLYNDAASDWGHRDSLVDPCNNRISIGVAWDEKKLYIAIFMVSEWAQWEISPKYDPNTGVFKTKGVIKLRPHKELAGIPVYSIYIFRDKPCPGYYWRKYYTIGEIYAAVVPKEFKGSYVGIYTIYADRYIIKQIGDKWYVDISFKLDLPKDGALYTVVMFSSPTGISWKPYSSRGNIRLDACKIFTYTIRT